MLPVVKPHCALTAPSLCCGGTRSSRPSNRSKAPLRAFPCTLALVAQTKLSPALDAIPSLALPEDYQGGALQDHRKDQEDLTAERSRGLGQQVRLDLARRQFRTAKESESMVLQHAHVGSHLERPILHRPAPLATKRPNLNRCSSLTPGSSWPSVPCSSTRSRKLARKREFPFKLNAWLLRVGKRRWQPRKALVALHTRHHGRPNP